MSSKKVQDKISPEAILEFCNLCNHAYEAVYLHKCLFDENPLQECLKKSIANEALLKLSVITQQYALLQIAKLHDKPTFLKYKNLSINFVLTHGDWSIELTSRLKSLQTDLEKFGDNLLDARRKIIAHADFDSILAKMTLGEFEINEVEEYLTNLQELVNLIHHETFGGPYPFNDLIKKDIEHLNILFEKALVRGK